MFSSFLQQINLSFKFYSLSIIIYFEHEALCILSSVIINENGCSNTTKTEEALP